MHLTTRPKSFRQWPDVSQLQKRHAPPNLAEPAPISLAPSQTWNGDDGSWSTFSLRIGTPPQIVRVLISTVGQETWAVLPDICNDPSTQAACESSEGASRGLLFNESLSTTWHQKNPSVYALGLEVNLGYTGSGLYGLDTVGLGVDNASGPALPNQVVAGIVTNEFYVGMLGIGPRPTNFSGFNDPQPSLLETLRNRSLIPSLSWSYTAGAPYRLKEVLGSVVFGGLDTSRFTPNSLTFPFAPDTDRNLVVGIQAISINSTSSSLDVLPSGVLAFIDSTIPHIWLPTEACKEVETALGLTWDPSTELYLVNDTLHQALLNINPSFTFKLGNSVSGGPTISITLPYASFDLTATPPYVQNTTKYFPLKRAANTTQITLGRTFLQEAYLTADFERSNFSISQCRFSEAPESLVAIPSANSPQISAISPLHKSAIGTGAIAAISITIPLIIVGTAALVWMYFQKRGIFAGKVPLTSKKEPESSEAADSITSPVSTAPSSSSSSSPFDAQQTQDSPIEEESPTSECAELDAPPLCELPHHPRYELPGDDLSSYPELSESQSQPPLRRKFSWEHDN